MQFKMAPFDERWKDALLITASVFAGIFILYQMLLLWARSMYKSWLSNPSTPLDVDAFVDVSVNPPKHIKVVAMHKLAVGDAKPKPGSVELSYVESPHVGGLKVTQNMARREGSNKEHVSVQDGAKKVEIGAVSGAGKPPVVIGTIRMGFGHHRIAYATCSWAKSDPAVRETYFHDLLNVDSSEADLIKSTDALYSKMSRITSNLGGIFEKLWGKAMLQGDSDALRATGLMAVWLRPLLKDLPLDTPIIATHSLVGLTAVACGFTNVLNLVIDNHAQWFVVVPGALNLCQGPVNYQKCLSMGIKAESLQIAGHWIPRELVDNIPTDCQRRIARAKSGLGENGGSKKPRRVLIPVGGAGAQRKFIVEFVRALGPLVKAGEVQLFLNAGDHKHMKSAFLSALNDIGVKDFDTVGTAEGVTRFHDRLLDPANEPNANVTLFAFDEYFPAVATTDILSRVTDILACKPSELAFYPVPKLMIRRVGDHEQYSALRAAELGDGTLEAREISDAMSTMNIFVGGHDLLTQMNGSIMKNNEIGIYDGCKNAVKIAVERAQAKN